MPIAERGPKTTCRAGLTTIEIIEQEGLVENARGGGGHALARLQEVKQRYPVIGDVRGLCPLLGIELVKDRRIKKPATSHPLVNVGERAQDQHRRLDIGRTQRVRRQGGDDSSTPTDIKADGGTP